MEIAENAALVVVDVQQGFEEEAYWGPRDNPEADRNIAKLIDVWQASGRPVVFVRHDSPSRTRRCGRGTRATRSRSTSRNAEGRARGRSCS